MFFGYSYPHAPTKNWHEAGTCGRLKGDFAIFSKALTTPTSRGKIAYATTISCGAAKRPMHCPYCNYFDTKVTDSRVAADGLTIRRRRECGKCGFRFSTVEAGEILELTVIKRDGRREPYSKEKLESGLRHSLEKRPYTTEKFTGLVQHIERDIQKKRKTELTSRDIGEVVMNRLKKFDQIAYIRFASVYRSFQDVASFTQELKGLGRTGGKNIKPVRFSKRSSSRR